MKTILLSLSILFTISLFSQTNLVINGNLENWTNSTTLDTWTIENDISQNTTDFAEGISSASFSINDNTLEPKILTLVPLVSGIEYTITYKFKYLNSNYNGMHPITMKIIRAGSATTTTNNSFASNNDWVDKSITFTPDQTGDYDLSFSIATLDGDPFQVLMDDIKVFDPTNLGVNDIYNRDSFKVYPTVTTDKVYFEQSVLEENFKIYVFDINGRIQNIKQHSNSIDLSILKSGIYFVNFKMSNINIVRKIIKK